MTSGGLRGGKGGAEDLGGRGGGGGGEDTAFGSSAVAGGSETTLGKVGGTLGDGVFRGEGVSTVSTTS